MSFSFLFFSQLIHKKVIERESGRTLGYISDVIADVTKIYPNITGLIISRHWFDPGQFLPIRCIEIPETKGPVLADNAQTEMGPKASLAKHEILVRETFLDKQIVDISGSRLVRVNDLHLLIEKANIWIVHMDVGFSGLLRRLGWLALYQKIVHWLVDYDLEDKFIQWKFVQPLADSNSAGTLALKISYSKLSNMHPADLADILEDLGTDERETAFKALDISTAAQTIEKLPMKTSLQLLDTLSNDILAKILDELPMDEAVDLLSELSRKKMNSVFRALPKKKVIDLKELLKHSKNTAGSLMNTEFITIKFNILAGQALDKIRTEHEKAESIYYIYVLSEQNSLVGVVSLRQLIIAQPDQPVADIMATKVIKIGVDTHIEKIGQLFLKYNFHMLPVVDSHHKIKGIISVRDALEAFSPDIKDEVEGGA
jgi:CBS domain-containing protein/sporulation protein YlmC with PRC-barrel domain